MILLLGIAIVVIVVFLYFYYPSKTTVVAEPVAQTTAPVENFNEDEIEDDWNEAIMKKNIESGVQQSHKKYVSNVRQYSSGANFTSVADDNISGIYTNWLGFSKPSFVEIGPGARQVPDINEEVLKRNKRLTFVNSYGF